MIESFFRHLENSSVRYLLVSGQATILYGAATFSEDVDLWVEPSPDNLGRLKLALRALRATYYKLTPPLHADMAMKHHGFHFVIPAALNSLPIFLDVMGRPPRVGAFDDAHGRSRLFDTEWGRIPTVSIPDLIELKKTQRPRDYPIIGRLVLGYMKERGDACSNAELEWAIDNVFSLSEWKRLVQTHPIVQRALPSNAGILQNSAEILAVGDVLPVVLEDKLEDWFDQRTAPLRKADRHFWRPVIDDLRQLRTLGELLKEGTLV